MKIIVLNGGKYASIEGAVVRFKNLVVSTGTKVVWVEPVSSRDVYKTEDLDQNVPYNVTLVKGSKCAKNPILELIAREKHFLKAVKEHPSDVCVIYNSWGTHLARKYLKRKGTPIIFDYIDLIHDFRSNPVEKYASKASTISAFKDSFAVITTAHKIFDFAAKHHGNVKLIPNGVNLEFFSNVTPLKLKHPSVGFVGGFGDWVDFELLMNVAKKLPSVTFYCIGDGVGRKVIEKHHLKNVVVSDGFVPQDVARRYMASFDVCVIPFKVNKLTDAVCPLKLFEYLSLKKPVVISPTFELKKIIKTEALFAESTDEWVDAISKIIASKKLAADLGAKGFLKAKEHSWKKLSKDYMKILVEAHEKKNA